jgi:hypothetical protein
VRAVCDTQDTIHSLYRSSPPAESSADGELYTAQELEDCIRQAAPGRGERLVREKTPVFSSESEEPCVPKTA